MKAAPGWTDLSGVKRNIVLTFDFPFTLHVNTQTAFCFHSCGSRVQEQADGCQNIPSAFWWAFIKRKTPRVSVGNHSDNELPLIAILKEIENTENLKETACHGRLTVFETKVKSTNSDF